MFIAAELKLYLRLVEELPLFVLLAICAIF